MMQYDTTLTNLEIIDLLERSSNFYPYGNNHVGYGVPNCDRLMTLLKNKNSELSPPQFFITNKKRMKVTDSFKDRQLSFFIRRRIGSCLKKCSLNPKKTS